jgi:hypothetical protein
MRATTLVLLAILAACKRAEPISHRSVLGKVLDDASDPVAGMAVRLTVEPRSRRKSKSSKAKTFEAQTNENGWFVFHFVPAGDAIVEALDGERAADRKEVKSGMVLLSVSSARAAAGPAAAATEPGTPEAPPPTPPAPPEFNVPEPPPEAPPTLTIDGTVTFDGAPLAGATVEAASADTLEAGWSDSEGKFLVGGLKAGQYRVVLTLPPDARDATGAYIVARRDTIFDATAGTEGMRIDLPAGATVRISTNFPSVSVEGEGIIARRYDVPPDGALNLRGFPPGRTRFLFHKPDGSLQPVEEDLRDGQTLPLEMRLPD